MPAALGHRWTSAEMPSLAGTSAVVTGGNSGIGWFTALELARHGCVVTLAVRTPAKGERAADRIREAVGEADVRVAELDLGSLDSVRAFADSWTGPLGLLVNNAGLMTPPRYQETSDGFELQFGTNHLGHFALTGQLLPALLSGPSSRVVTVSSIAHRQGRGDVLEANPRSSYRPGTAYGNSKLANLLFAQELQRRASAAGASLTSTAAHPGLSATGLVTSEQGLGALPGVRVLAPLALRLLAQSAEAGAEPTLYAATVAAPGSYSGPQGLRETRGAVGPANIAPLAADPVLAEHLWKRSEELTEVRYDWETPAT